MNKNSILYKKRKFWNRFNLTASVITTLFGLFFLVWILWVLFATGFSSINWATFTEITPGPGNQGGGLSNAIWGSVILTFLGVIFGAPIGVLAGTYLAEFDRRSTFASTVRFVNDILLSSPSIIIGIFINIIIVIPTGHFSAWAGGVALAMIMIPVVVRTTEDMLRLVPDSMREAAAALGSPKWKVITKVVYRSARAGMLTGLILGIARISGETAPLLFTALNNQFEVNHLNEPIANLPSTIYFFATSPDDNWISLAWAGALLITLTVLLLNILARVFLRQKTTG